MRRHARPVSGAPQSGGRGGGWLVSSSRWSAARRSAAVRRGGGRPPSPSLARRPPGGPGARSSDAQQVGQRGDDVLGLASMAWRRLSSTPWSRRSSTSSVSSCWSGRAAAPRRHSPGPRRRGRRSGRAGPGAGGCGAHRGLELVLRARENEVRAEHREPQPLGLAVEVRRGADVVLVEEAAQVDRLGLVVGVATPVVGLALRVLPEAQLRRRAGAPVLVRGDARRPRPAVLPSPK